MNGIFKTAFADKITRWGLGVSSIILVSETLYIGLIFKYLPPVIPLFNQLPWGDERLGSKFEIFLPVFAAGFILGLNFYLLNRLYEELPLLCRMLCITTLLISILCFVFIIRTLQLVI